MPNIDRSSDAAILFTASVRGVGKRKKDHMPTYEYECLKCDHSFERFQSITADPLKRCPECRGKIRRVIGTGAGIIFKGSGFYETDYRSDSYKKAAKADTDSSKDSSSSSDGSGSSGSSDSSDSSGSSDSKKSDTKAKKNGKSASGD